MFPTELIENATLLLAVCFLQRFIVEQWPRNEIPGQIASGILFGLASILAMVMAFEFSTGVIFDSRTAVLSMGALFGGPLVAFISAAIAAGFRAYLGGAGELIGICVILSASAAGLLWRFAFKSDSARYRLLSLAGLGVTVHVMVVGWFFLLPSLSEDTLLRIIAPPFVGYLTAASVAMGVLLRKMEESRTFDKLLDDSEARFRSLFNAAAVAIFEEDFTKPLKRLQQLRDQGVRDLRAYLNDHPEVAAELAKGIKVLNVNKAALKLFEVSSVRDLIDDIQRYFGPGAEAVFIDEMCAIWNGLDEFHGNATYRTINGTLKACVVSLPIPKTEEAARCVPVSIIDVTPLKESEQRTIDERRRLDEILWGTNVGTWEWNVQSGEVFFNERWAGIVGYTLEELQPISIQTWIDLAHPEDLETSNQKLKDVFEGTSDHYECELRMKHKDGHWVWVLDRGKVVEWTDDDKPLRMSGTHAEITERKTAEERAQRHAIVRDTILRCHRAILGEQDEMRLFQSVAEILVEARDYALVWIGIPTDGDLKNVEIAAKSGSHSSYLDAVTIHWSEDKFSDGPTGRAIKTGRVEVNHDPFNAPNYEPWSKDAEEHQFKSSIAAPVIIDREVAAVLNVYSSVPNAFDDVEISLITEFAGNIGLAMNSIRLSQKTEELHSELETAALGAVSAIAATVEKRDPYTSGHQSNVAEISDAIAKELNWDTRRRDGLRLGAMIHDIGKIYIPAEILNRPGRLTDSEFGMIKSHPQVGYEILEKTTFPWPIKEMVAQHHERLDGSGYPAGLKADQIIEEAKVIAVADVVDAITSHRPYRPGKGVDAALEEIARGRGTAYDPVIADTCTMLIRDKGFRWGDLLKADKEAAALVS
jgi:PAS domain S-box-containing protein/putative nucleotidyltransferase with HDIG domain